MKFHHFPITFLFFLATFSFSTDTFLAVDADFCKTFQQDRKKLYNTLILK